MKPSLSEAIQGKYPQRLTSLRYKIQLVLRLVGEDANGQHFEEVTTTEDVSVSGFLCVCATTLTKDAEVDVYFGQQGGQLVGRARLTRRDSTGVPRQKYGFCFTEKKGEWILQ